MNLQSIPAEFQQHWLEELGRQNCFWLHDQNPLRPHALLTSGQHSDGFVNWSDIVFNNPITAGQACHNLIAVFRHHTSMIERPQIVVGPAFGAMSLALEVAKNFGDKTGWAFTIPSGEGSEKILTLEKRFRVEGKTFISVEDVITTAGTVSKNIQVILDKGGLPMPFVLALTNRSGLQTITVKDQEFRIIALIDQPMNNWAETECPLCALGSQAIRPKEANNWVLLNSDYPIA